MLKLLMTAALVLAPVAAVAAPVTWECSYSKRAASGWIGEQATYVIDEATQTATAFDPHIKFANKKPVDAVFRRKSNGQYVLKWRIENMPTRQTRTVSGLKIMDRETTVDPQYTVWLNPRTQRVKIRANVGMTTNVINGSGSCSRKG